jgi:hypothetical protein
VSKSLTKLASALTGMGHRVSPETVSGELLKLGFSRQGNRKADEGSRHRDRNAQFEYINAAVVSTQRRGQPVVCEFRGNPAADSDLMPAGVPI